MKQMNFVIFLSVFFAVYGLLNFYIFIRGWQAIPQGSPLKSLYLGLFLLFALAFLAGRFLERVWASPVSDILVWIGSFWFGALLYFFLSVVVLDLLRAINVVIPVYPSWIRLNYDIAKVWTLAAAVVMVSIVLAIGHLNASYPRVRNLALSIPKKVAGIDSLTVVSVSDIHLGTIIGRERLDNLVKKVNSLNPDLVLIPGDLVDEDLGPVIRGNLGESLRNLRSRFGVLAVTGNHEYIGGVERACKYMTDHGITVLRDSLARVDSGIVIVGREDRSMNQFAGKKRRTLEDLMSGVDRTMPIIVMDHQPFGLDESVRNGVDLQISGHTHHGQMWPLSYITEAIYEVSWGYIRKGGTHIYVSSGAGTWGPPVRIGNTPEIVCFKLTFG
jgi:predicted MPP superfamily phosphohydrolase